MDAFVQTEQLHLCKWKRYDGQGHVLFTIFFIRTSVRKHIAFLLLWFRTNTSKFIRTNSFILLCVHPKAPFTWHNLLSNRFDNQLNVCMHDTTGRQTSLTTGCIVYRNIQLVIKPVWQPGCLTRLTTGWTNGCIVYTAGCQTGCTTRFDNRLVERTATGCSVAVRSTLRLDVCLHDTAGCHTSYTTGLTTAVSCKRGIRVCNVSKLIHAFSLFKIASVWHLGFYKR